MTPEEQNTNVKETSVGLAPSTEEDAQELADEIQEERTAPEEQSDEEAKEDPMADGPSETVNEIAEGYREATEEEIKEMRSFSEMFKGKSPITAIMELNERIVLLEKKVF